MCLLDACICIQNTHIYACFVCISMRVLYAYICVFFTHIYACFVRIYTRLKDTYIIEPIYHEPIFKQMANRITLVMALLIKIQHIPPQKHDSNQMFCMRQALVYHVVWNCI